MSDLRANVLGDVLLALMQLVRKVRTGCCNSRHVAILSTGPEGSLDCPVLLFAVDPGAHWHKPDCRLDAVALQTKGEE